MKAYSKEWFRNASEAALDECLDMGGKLEKLARAEFKRRATA